jgi:D-sedoheptulose 7-phosphate isomerase
MESLLNKVQRVIKASIETKQQLLEDLAIVQQIAELANKVTESLKGDGKILLAGNGGSAADAQHIAAELSGRFYSDRAPLFAEALHVNTSYLTAVANDYSYDEVYSRLVEAKGREGDVLIGISTSGNSKNIIRAFEQARKQGVFTVGFTGANGGSMNGNCDLLIKVPSDDTPRIQEAHILIGHIMCELTENALFDE